MNIDWLTGRAVRDVHRTTATKKVFLLMSIAILANGYVYITKDHIKFSTNPWRGLQSHSSHVRF